MIAAQTGLFHFRTTDPGAFSEHLAELGPDVEAQPLALRGFRAELLGARLPHVTVFRVRIANARVVAEADRGYLGLTVPLSATARIADCGEPAVFAPGSAHVSRSEDPFEVEALERAPMLVATFDRGLVADLWPWLTDSKGMEMGPRGGRLRLSMPDGAALWADLATAWRLLEASQGGLRHEPLLQALEERLLAHVAACTDPSEASGREAELGPAFMRRAEEYIATCATRPLSPAVLAEHVGVSYRTLLRAFRRKWGIPPSVFHRRRRLEAVQRVLLGETSESATVSEVALRHGFWHMGHFGAHYRKAFGETPSTTLRR